MILTPLPRSTRRRIVALSALLVLAGSVVHPAPADGQTRAGRDDRVPSELWRTYPLDPSNGATTIEKDDASRPQSSRTPARSQGSPGERPGAGEEARRGAEADGSYAGVALVVAVSALGVLVALFALLRFPAPGAARHPPVGLPEWTAVRGVGPRLHGLPAGLARRSRRWMTPLLSAVRSPRDAVPFEPRPAGPAGGAPPASPRNGAPGATTGPGGGRILPPDVEDLKAKARTKAESERRGIADADATTFKRKLAPRAESDPLAAKKRGADDPLEKTAAKPATRVRDDRRVPPVQPNAPAQPPRPPAAERHARRTLALRPVGEPALPPPVRIAPIARPPECTIIWWRGYVKSRFLAICGPALGEDTLVAASPYFRWRRAEPPPETPAIAQALQALVESLERKGWTVCGRGARWFSVRLQQTFGEEPVETRQADGPETGQKGSM